MKCVKIEYEQFGKYFFADINLLDAKESRLAFMSQEVTDKICETLFDRYGFGITDAKIIKWYN